MPDNPQAPDDRMIRSVHTMVTDSMLRQVDELRQAIQRDLDSHLVISRGDVVRLALGRLYLAYLSHLSELPGPPADLLDRWDTLAAVMREWGTVAPWLVPGPSVCLLHGQETAKARSKAKAKKGQ